MDEVGEAKDELAKAAKNALNTIANAAEQATKVLSNAAAEAIKLTKNKNDSDHDTLIEIRTEVRGLKEDIADIKSGTSSQLGNHEIRLVSLEVSKTRQQTTMSIGIGILTLLVSLIVYHIIAGGGIIH